MINHSIDINADVGEGLNNEADIMPYLSSCNIACGGHAGNLQTMTKVVKLAKVHDVKIGAHPSYPDKENFGRAVLDISNDRLFFILREQIMDLLHIVESENSTLNHVKPHGALYNFAAKDEKTAICVLDVVESIPMDLRLYVPPNSIISELSKSRPIEIVYEAFADRNYNDDLSLVSRADNDAIINDKVKVLDHLLKMIKDKTVISINGKKLPMEAATFCVHGDTENALEILKYMNEKLPKYNIKIQ